MVLYRVDAVKIVFVSSEMSWVSNQVAMGCAVLSPLIANIYMEAFEHHSLKIAPTCVCWYVEDTFLVWPPVKAKISGLPDWDPCEYVNTMEIENDGGGQFGIYRYIMEGMELWGEGFIVSPHIPIFIPAA